MLKNIQWPIYSVFDENLKAASVLRGLKGSGLACANYNQKINTILKSSFYIRETLRIISRQQRENLSTELKAKEERDTGIQKNNKLKFVFGLLSDNCIV